MKRYRTIAAYVGYDDDGNMNSTADEVLEDDNDPVFSGLYDSMGRKLYHETVKRRIGFHCPKVRIKNASR